VPTSLISRRVAVTARVPPEGLRPAGNAPTRIRHSLTMRKVLAGVLLGLLGPGVAACPEVAMTSKTESLAIVNTTQDSVKIGVSTGSMVYGVFVAPGYNVPVAPQESLCVRPSPVAFEVEVWLVGDTATTGANLNYWTMPSVGSWAVVVWPDSIHAVPAPAC
jgi:hypothetical protein